MSFSLMAAGQADSRSSWGRADGFQKEERTIQDVRSIVIKGAIELVFFRAPVPHLVVAGETQKAINSVKTSFAGGALVIDREGSNVAVSGGNISVTGSGNIVAGRNYYEQGVRKTQPQQLGACIVGVALPELATLRLAGAGTAVLNGLSQSAISIEVSGAGDVTASGEVNHLEAVISGAGDLDLSDLTALSAALLISGAGDIDATVQQAVRARISGAGNIVVRGTPASCDESITGAGKIKFKK